MPLDYYLASIFSFFLTYGKFQAHSKVEIRYSGTTQLLLARAPGSPHLLGDGRYKCNGKFSSVAQLCPTLCDPMNCSTPGLPVHHQLPESTQTHVHGVGDAIHPSHPLSSPSPPALNLFQHQGLFQ